MISNIFETKIEFLKGVGPQKSAILNKDINIFTYGDLIQYYPYRYEDRTQYHKIKNIEEISHSVQIIGEIYYKEIIGEGRKSRLVASFRDETGTIDLIWFQSIKWVNENIKIKTPYVIYGKANQFNGTWNIVHPEMELFQSDKVLNSRFHPVYNTSEKMKMMGLDSKSISKLIKELLTKTIDNISENLTQEICNQLHLISKPEAMINIHFPKDDDLLRKATFRLKFEELFYSQIRILRLKDERKIEAKGITVSQLPLVNQFYKSHLPFELTDAQKKVIRQVYIDLQTGKQMNRLLQGDVGSGKTIVAFICMLMAIDGGTQACIMAPTEILAQQHFQGLSEFANMLGIGIAILTGSTKKKDRTEIHTKLLNGEIKILVGTHALLEPIVQFQYLGLCVIDEQHRFGVAQRSRLWEKNQKPLCPPHILVMTATPIPRTLAMTLYGDLDVSVIDQLPAGRKPISTYLKFENQRLWLFGFMKSEIAKGRQIYIVYPLIEESEKMDLLDLMTGYDELSKTFPRPQYQLGIVHGKMKPADKEFEIQRFVKKETHILVATTVIEVGVNVPNASVMIIENAERFGLSQLHQLRGRVGRGAEQSYCVMMGGTKITKETRERLNIMVQTNNGFEISEADLRLRGPGELYGTKQSGVLDLMIADLARDGEILSLARSEAKNLLKEDPNFDKTENINIKNHISKLKKNESNWARIS